MNPHAYTHCLYSSRFRLVDNHSNGLDELSAYSSILAFLWRYKASPQGFVRKEYYKLNEVYGERIERGYALTPRTINLFLLRTQYALVRVKGIEPSTYCLKGNCSTTELHSHNN